MRLFAMQQIRIIKNFLFFECPYKITILGLHERLANNATSQPPGKSEKTKNQFRLFEQPRITQKIKPQKV